MVTAILPDGRSQGPPLQGGGSRAIAPAIVVQFAQMGQIRHIALHAEPAAQDAGNALRVQLALGAVVMDVDALGMEP